LSWLCTVGKAGYWYPSFLVHIIPQNTRLRGTLQGKD